MTQTSPCQLYLISPPSVELSGFADSLNHAFDGGEVACFQLRLKGCSEAELLEAAETSVAICHQRGVQCIINDRADVAKLVGADGVHIGESDGALAKARKILGNKKVIGVSCYDDLDRALTLGEEGADYVSFGAFYPTKTKEAKGKPKPQLLSWWHENTVLPSVAIGGITPENCAPLVQAGADFIAVVSSVWEHPEGAEAGVKAMVAAIHEAAG